MTPHLDLLATPADEADLGAGTEVHEATWPRTQLVSAGLLGALGLVLALPVILSAPTLLQGILFAPVLILTVVTTRWIFGGGRADAPFSARAARALGGATAGVTSACSGSAILGTGLPTPLPALAITGAVTGVLVVAAAARKIELTYLAASRRVFLIARGDQFRDVAREVRRAGAMAIVGGLDPISLKLSAQELTERLSRAGAGMLVLSKEAASNVDVCAAAAQFNLTGGRVRDLDSFYGRHFRKVPLSELTPSWFLFDIAEIHRPWVYGLLKRAVETTAAALLLVTLLPCFVVIAVTVRASSCGPILFRQQRVGRHDRPFTIVKFRTMNTAAAEATAAWAGAESHRVTSVGRLLRRLRADELPQLWNILLGHMSVVGPRPEQVALVQRLEHEIPYYRARHCVRPGLTGWAQVSCGYAGSSAGTIDKLQYDFFYVRNQGFRLDALIVMKTLRAVARGGS